MCQWSKVYRAYGTATSTDDDWVEVECLLHKLRNDEPVFKGGVYEFEKRLVVVGACYVRESKPRTMEVAVFKYDPDEPYRVNSKPRPMFVKSLLQLKFQCQELTDDQKKIFDTFKVSPSVLCDSSGEQSEDEEDPDGTLGFEPGLGYEHPQPGLGDFNLRKRSEHDDVDNSQRGQGKRSRCKKKTNTAPPPPPPGDSAWADIMKKIESEMSKVVTSSICLKGNSSNGSKTPSPPLQPSDSLTKLMMDRISEEIKREVSKVAASIGAKRKASAMEGERINPAMNLYVRMMTLG